MAPPGTPLKLLIVGHGRMGRLVESARAEHGVEVVGVLDAREQSRRHGAR